jgi:hypothetical protein
MHLNFTGLIRPTSRTPFLDSSRLAGSGTILFVYTSSSTTHNVSDWRSYGLFLGVTSTRTGSDRTVA